MTFDCLTNFLKLTLSRSVHANFFLAFNTLTNFATSARSTRSQRQTRHSFGFGPIIQNSDRSRIRTNRKFGPFSSFVRRSSFVVRRSSFVVRSSFSVTNTWTFFKLLCTQEPPHRSSKAVHRFYSFPLAEHWSSYYCELICLRKTLASFTVEPFNIYFEDLMWLFTHLCRLDKQDSRLKISLSWHFTSSLKTFTVDSNILTNIFVLSLNCNTFSNDYFAHKNHRFWEFLRLFLRSKLARFRCSLVVRSLCTQEPSTPRISDTGTPGWR